MGMGSWWHWVILLAVALLLFGGGGKIPKLMRDMGQGITAFKRGLKEDKEKPAEDDTAAALEADPKSKDKAASS